MKKGIIIFMMGMFTLHLTAQTYNGGTWYSLYSTKEQKTSDNGFTSGKDFDYSVFAPTTGNLSFEWQKSGTFFGKCIFTLKIKDNNDTEVATISSGATSSTGHEEWVPESKKVSANITKLIFNQTTTLQGSHKNVTLPLAQHILLAEGTYGTTAYTEPFDFGSFQWGETAESVDEVALRSFLTNGNITITSSEPDVFRINSADNTEGVTYNVGANACASANGAAEQACADGVLGDINLYGFKIYFCPQEAKEYSGTITITDGTSTATVAVKGTGLKKDQTITFAPETPIYDTATIALATASSNLEPSYTFSPEGIVSFNGEKMVITTLSAPAQVTITASQEGNDYYNAATPVEQTITIYPSKTFGEDSAFVCPDDSVEYDGKHYQVGVHENVLLSVKNQYGSDSLVTFTVHALPTYLFEESKTMQVGEDSTWRKKDLSGYAVGEYVLYDSLQTVAGCDSVYQLKLTVTKVAQTITFELPATIKVGEFIALSAEATSGLTVTYSFSADSLISVNENVLTAILPGELVITATQEGDDTYAAAEPVSCTLTIVPGSTPTDIREVSDMQPKAAKLMYRGQLFILRDNQYYHVQGTRVR